MNLMHIGARPTRSYGLLEGLLAAWRSSMANRLLPQTARSGRLLDVGCGSMPHFLRHTQFRVKVGLDRAVTADPRLRGLHLVRCDAADHCLPFRRNSFSAVALLAVVEHLEPGALIPVLTECRRVLDSGGILVLTWPAPWTAGMLRAMARLKLVSRVEIDDHQGHHTVADVLDALEAAGFRRGAVSHGRFELGANNWLRAVR